MTKLQKGDWVRYTGTLLPEYAGGVYEVIGVGWPTEDHVELKLAGQTVIDPDGPVPSIWGNGFLAAADEVKKVATPNGGD